MRKLASLMALAVAISWPAFAQETKITLKDAIYQALSDNHLVKAADYDLRGAKSAVGTSRSRYFPRIYLEETASTSNAPTRVFMMKLDQGRFTQDDFEIPSLNDPASTTDFRTAATLEMPLLDFTIGKSVDMAKRDVGAKRFALDRRKEEIAFRVFASYLEVQRAKAHRLVAEQQVSDAREHLRLAAVRSQEGIGLRSDELRTRTFLSEMEQQQISAANNERLAMMRLALIIGRPGKVVDVSEELRAPDLSLGNEELIRLALANRQDLKELEEGVEKAEDGVGLARNALLPTIYGSATYQMNDKNTPFGRDNDSWMVGATLRWEAFDGFRRVNERDRARAFKNMVQEHLEHYREELAYQVTEAYLRREETGKRLEISRHAVLEAAEGLRLVEKRFENSLATLVDLLDAQTSLNRARANLVETEAAYALATAGVYHAAGIFLKEGME